MGLIKAITGTALSVLSETWKDYFVCDSLDNSTLMIKGVKRGRGGSGEIITNGSGIVVNEGQCALIIEEGNILEVACEPGNYTFDTSISPSVFDGGFAGIKNTFYDLLGRFTYGGEVNKSQRVYYVNTKEIIDNKFGTATPIPFSFVYDKATGSEVEIGVRCNGEFTFKIVNPLLFYKNVAGNKADRYVKDEIASIMRSELLDAMNPALGKLSGTGLGYSSLPSHTPELKEALNEVLDKRWGELRGIELESLAISSVTISEEDARKIRDIQLSAINRDPNSANATIISATADAMRDAANNANGAAYGFMNVNMAQNSMSGLIQKIEEKKDLGGGFCAYCGAALPNYGKFCPTCGKQVKE